MSCTASPCARWCSADWRRGVRGCRGWGWRGPSERLARRLARFLIGRILRGPATRYLFENSEDPREFGLDPAGGNVTIVGGAGVDPARVPVMPEPPAPPVKVAVVR